MSLLSLVINLMHPCWIKVFISLKRNHTDPKPLNGSISMHKCNKALAKSSLHNALLRAVMPQQPVFVLQQDLKSSRGLHEEMKKAASNNAKQVKHTLQFTVFWEDPSWWKWQITTILFGVICFCKMPSKLIQCEICFYTRAVLIHRWLIGLWRNHLKDDLIFRWKHWRWLELTSWCYKVNGWSFKKRASNAVELFTALIIQLFLACAYLFLHCFFFCDNHFNVLKMLFHWFF